MIATFLPVAAKTVTLQKLGLDNSLENNVINYTIKSSIDLKGDTLMLPKNSKLKFKGEGRFSNGCIIGYGTQINASSNMIFQNITINGTWNNKKVFSSWINFPEGDEPCDSTFHNLMMLCRGKRLTHFYLDEGTYFVSSYHNSAPIIIPSNTYWHNKAKIIMLPSDLSWYNTVLLDKVDNVTIDGGIFVGDVLTHIGDKGEWGHGIKCAGATNISLKNITCLYHWGDGIDLIEGLDNSGNYSINCNNVHIKSVKCLRNRRQGMSIEAAQNVKVNDSEFAFTGLPNYTAPGAGLDIEPWSDNGIKIDNININNCNFHNNKGPDFFIMLKPYNNEDKKLISVTKCKMGTCQLWNSYNIMVSKCMISNILTIKNSSHIDFYNCDISKYHMDNSNTKINFQDCLLKN